MNNYRVRVISFKAVAFGAVLVVVIGLMCTLAPGVRNRGFEGFATADSGTRPQDVPVMTLKTSDGPIKTDGPISALIGSSNGDETVYMANGLTGGVAAYQGGPNPSYRPFADTVGPFAVVRSRDSIAYIDASSKVVIAEPTGRILLKIDSLPAISLATLRNGNVVVASPTQKHFLHLYTETGRLLRSFGKLRNHGQVDQAEVRFLHKGKILVDAADNIYYIYHFLPLVQVFSPTGELKREIHVQGDAISLQQEVAERFFSLRKPGTIGGIGIINSGAIDLKTGHLWLGLNGSSFTGIVYEYGTNGEKLTEYALEVVRESTDPYVIIDVMDLAITPSKLYVVTRNSQVFGFPRGSNSVTPQGNIQRRGTIQRVAYSIKPVARTPPAGGAVLQVPGCGTTQDWPACGFNCPPPVCNGTTPTATSSNSASLDCKASLVTALASGYVVVAAPCTPFPAGTPMHLRGGCRADVTICRTGANGAPSTTSHNAIMDCVAPECPAGGEGGGQLCFETGGGGEGGPGYGELCQSPILIDIQGNGFDLTDPANGVDFDLKPGGLIERTAWTSPASDDAFLVLDRNGNGTIDDGSELFGNNTPQPPSEAPNGFLALAEFDKPANGGNGDGRIDRNDAIFSSLRLWQDGNHNGISEPGEIRRLQAPGLAAIDLDYRESRRVDQYGNWFRYRARVRDAQGAHLGRWAWDVFFVIE